MKLGHFLVKDVSLTHDFWLHDAALLDRWNRELHLGPGQRVVLFDGAGHNRLYQIVTITDKEAHVVLITDFEQTTPKHNVYLLWPPLGGAKNDQVLQKGTEVGVSHFLPLITDGSAGAIDHKHAQALVARASEQCGRSDIPTVREPLHIAKAIEQLAGKVRLYVCDAEGDATVNLEAGVIGLVISPDSGWSDAETGLFGGLKKLKFDPWPRDTHARVQAALHCIEQNF
jgi:16S rRNA (uracil1498-N3)-methyltransferase